MRVSVRIAIGVLQPPMGLSVRGVRQTILPVFASSPARKDSPVRRSSGSRGRRRGPARPRCPRGRRTRRATETRAASHRGRSNGCPHARRTRRHAVRRWRRSAWRSCSCGAFSRARRRRSLSPRGGARPRSRASTNRVRASSVAEVRKMRCCQLQGEECPSPLSSTCQSTFSGPHFVGRAGPA